MIIRPDVRAWMESAAPGEDLTYYVGYLARDRGQDPGLGQLADTLLGAFDRGWVYLFQRKIGDSLYAYQARRTGRNLRGEVR